MNEKCQSCVSQCMDNSHQLREKTVCRLIWKTRNTYLTNSVAEVNVTSNFCSWFLVTSSWMFTKSSVSLMNWEIQKKVSVLYGQSGRQSVVIGKGAYLVNRVELRVRAVDVREVGFKKILHHLQVGIFLVDVHLVAEQVGVYFCKRKGSVHLLGVYWTCIGRWPGQQSP